jgi:hypothetical protein
MAALLRLPESAGAIRFHPSTNGEYVREYGRSLPRRSAFAGFVRRFDALVYEANERDERDYLRMSGDFEQVEVEGRTTDECIQGLLRDTEVPR